MALVTESAATNRSLRRFRDPSLLAGLPFRVEPISPGVLAECVGVVVEALLFLEVWFGLDRGDP